MLFFRCFDQEVDLLLYVQIKLVMGAGQRKAEMVITTRRK